jgi:nucleoside-diphosphate-sugar epimerase
MDIVVLGDGLLGSELIKQTGWDCISRKKDGFDITKPETFLSYFIENYDGVVFTTKYNYIVNCIAHTDTYSPSKELNWNINYKGVADLVDFCNKWKIKLIHVSTDYVYTNSVLDASENDIPIHGNNWYSYTKLLADAYIELKSNNYLICRGTHKPYPFPYNKAWVDQVGNFDYVDNIAKIIIKLIQLNSIGVINIGTELKSIYDLALKSNKDILPSNKPDATPSNTSMSLDKLKSII